MRIKIFIGILACILLASSSVSAESAEKKSVINIMIDADISPNASIEEGQEASDLLLDIYSELQERNIPATVFSTQDLIWSYARMRITYLGKDPNIELAMSGNHSDEKLSEESLSDQRTILKTSKEYVESCRVCGTNEVTVRGFLPQSFDQNEDTYKALDELGIEYNAGFQAGAIYGPDHQDDTWPYKLEGHNFYAVPVSTFELSGQKVPLYDKYFTKNGLSSAQWHDALVAKFNEAQERDEPMVILLTKSVSTSGDFFDALKKFLDFAISKDATFVTTMDLVNISRGEAYVPPADANRICTTCNQKNEESVGISIDSIAETTNATNVAVDANASEG